MAVTYRRLSCPLPRGPLGCAVGPIYNTTAFNLQTPKSRTGARGALTLLYDGAQSKSKYRHAFQTAEDMCEPLPFLHGSCEVLVRRLQR